MDVGGGLRRVVGVAKEWTPDDIFDVLADATVRAILIATNAKNRSVKDLDNELDTSQSSIYRRVDIMADYGLLVEQMKVDKDGHHYSVYMPNFEKIDIRLEGDEMIVTVHTDNGTASEFRLKADP